MPINCLLLGGGGVFGFFFCLRAKGTLISEPRLSTPCEMRFFPRDKGKMAFSKRYRNPWTLNCGSAADNGIGMLSTSFRNTRGTENKFMFLVLRLLGIRHSQPFSGNKIRQNQALSGA